MQIVKHCNGMLQLLPLFHKKTILHYNGQGTDDNEEHLYIPNNLYVFYETEEAVFGT